MAQSKEVFTQAIRLQGRPVCITLHSGKTYIGYITDMNSSGLALASVGAQQSTSSGNQGSRSKQDRAGSRPRAVVPAADGAAHVSHPSVHDRASLPSVPAPASRTPKYQLFFPY
ncbi:hypothetical protein [Paenibacillus sp. D2_2]|uniref:hypothetical protein n=1 Tax=Paenibacillus sp. D2_2 TaxID=3073092 RepID=UPI0035BEE0C5